MSSRWNPAELHQVVFDKMTKKIENSHCDLAVFKEMIDMINVVLFITLPDCYVKWKLNPEEMTFLGGIFFSFGGWCESEIFDGFLQP